MEEKNKNSQANRKRERESEKDAGWTMRDEGKKETRDVGEQRNIWSKENKITRVIIIILFARLHEIFMSKKMLLSLFFSVSFNLTNLY